MPTPPTPNFPISNGAYFSQLDLRCAELETLPMSALAHYGRGLGFRLSHLMSDFMQAPECDVLGPMTITEGDNLYHGFTQTRAAHPPGVGNLKVRRWIAAPFGSLKEEIVNSRPLQLEPPYGETKRLDRPQRLAQVPAVYIFKFYLGAPSSGPSIDESRPKKVAELETTIRAWAQVNEACSVDSAPYYPRSRAQRFSEEKVRPFAGRLAMHARHFTRRMH